MRRRRRAKTITLKYAGKCADCGAVLEVGTTARWYGRGRIYGLDCHEDRRHAPVAHESDHLKGDDFQAQLEGCLSDDQEAIRYDGNEPIPQSLMFD